MPGKYPEDTRLLVEEGLKKYFPEVGHPEELYKAMSYSLFAGGKRFRAVLAIESAKVFGTDPEDVMPAACAVEFIHTYSLIHDDLPALDDDDLRRGKPTCHVKFGEDMAILAGDALNTEAFRLVSSEQKAIDAGRIVWVIRELATASGASGMVGGQVVDIQSEGMVVDAETLKFIHEKKTGELIKASVRAGAILANASERDLALLTDYAIYLGLAFQIVDDILDVVGDAAVLGKAVGSDVLHEKATYPALYGLEKAKEMARMMTDKAKEALSQVDGDTTVLAELADFVFDRDF